MSEREREREKEREKEGERERGRERKREREILGQIGRQLSAAQRGTVQQLRAARRTRNEGRGPASLAFQLQKRYGQLIHRVVT